MDIKHLHDLHNHIAGLEQKVKGTYDELTKALRAQLPDGTKLTIQLPGETDSCTATSVGVTYSGRLWVRDDSGETYLINPTWIVP